MNTRDELVDYLTQRRLAAKKNVTNLSRMRELIRGDLEQLDDADLQAEYNHATGATKRPTNAAAIDYRVTDLDHAISLALVCLDRGFTTNDTQAIMLDDYPAAIAGRALAIAQDGAYRIHVGRTIDVSPDLVTSKPMKLSEYLATHPGPAILRTAPDEPAA